MAEDGWLDGEYVEEVAEVPRRLPRETLAALRLTVSLHAHSPPLDLLALCEDSRNPARVEEVLLDRPVERSVPRRGRVLYDHE
jgi:hypothetical protein